MKTLDYACEQFVFAVVGYIIPIQIMHYDNRFTAMAS